MAELLVLNTKQYPDIYEKWLAETNKSLLDFKRFWRAKLRLRIKTGDIAGTFGYGMNASEITAAEENADHEPKEAINGYGAAHATAQAALNSMVNTDTSIQKLADNMEELAQLVCQLTNAQATPPQQVYY